MAEEVQVFNFEQMNVRTIELEDEVWFVAVDVAKALDIKNTTQALSRLDDDERAMFNIGRQGEANIISEAGLYRFIGNSRKSEAKKFTRWVTHEVLPSIRKHGAYMTNEKIEEILLSPDTLIKIATELKQERAEKMALKEENSVLLQQNNELKPKADYTDIVLSNDTLVPITFIAKDYGMTGTAMNRLLHELGVQYKQSNVWLLYAKHQTKGWTQSETFETVDKDGRPHLKLNTKWTQKGRLGLYELLKENGYLPLIEQETELGA